MMAPSVEAPPEAPGPRGFLGRDRALAAFTIVMALVILLGFLASAGIWAPPELETAELARRIARGLFQADLPVQGGEGALPTRGELGRGELPFTAIALGFRLFGARAWAGRLPLALCCIAGLLAVGFGVSRLASRRAAWLSALALSTMPLYFLQARTLLGDGVIMAAGAAAMSGFGVAVFDARSTRVRWLGVALGALGLVAGFLTRGLALGVSVPLLGVGVTWLALSLARAPLDRFATVCGATTLIAGAAAGVAFGVVLRALPPGVYSIWVGTSTGPVRPVPTFDAIVGDLGHAAFPWSALIPPAIARALGGSPALSTPDGARSASLRLMAWTTASAALFAETALAPEFGVLPFIAPYALAALGALALLDLERGVPASRWFGLAVSALVVLLLLDFRNFPEKGLVAFGVPDVVFPASFAVPGFRRLLVAALPLAASFLFFVEDAPGSERKPVFQAADYARWFQTLRSQWSGHLWFGLLAVGVAALGLDVIQFVTARAPAFAAVPVLGETPRLLVRSAWVSVVALMFAPALVLTGRDVVRVILAPGHHLPTLRRFPSTRDLAFGRGASAAVLSACAGAGLSFSYYPALMHRTSATSGYELYERIARPSEPLGVLDLSAAVASYQVRTSPVALLDVDDAESWMLSGPGRRFVLLKFADLPALNAAFRAATRPRRNLPVLDASGELALAVSRLAVGERNQNPLDSLVFDRAPTPAHPLDVNLGDHVLVLGWEIRDRAGHASDHLSRREKYEFIIYYRVLEPFSTNWETFVHLDGFQQRYNGDHPTLEGLYPLPLWLPGDFVADRHSFELDGDFPPGTYRVYFGLYSGSRRLEVRRGRHDDNRVFGGEIDVR